MPPIDWKNRKLSKIRVRARVVRIWRPSLIEDNFVKKCDTIFFIWELE